MIVPKQVNILKYLQQSKENIVAPCNGKGICGKCKVLIPSKPVPNNAEIEILSSNELNQGVRLACTRTTTESTEVINLSDKLITNIASDFQLNYEVKPYLTIQADGVYRFHKKIPKQPEKNAYGIAVDIGTTTVVVVLLDLLHGYPVEKEAFINPQSAYGSDVITRIQYASTSDQLELLGRLIRSRIDQSIKSILIKNSIAYSDLYEVVVSGNTTMYHLLLGLDPTPMAFAPYVTEHLDSVELPYNMLFSDEMDATVTVFGGLDSFVGGDIVSGIFSENLHHKDVWNLLVDLGTNGEIVLVNKDKIFGASTAAGPAFEGVNITCGIGAVDGAICNYGKDNSYNTINNKPAVGICGSGLIDIVSQLITQGEIDPSGRMKKDFYITDTIRITPKDIREIQLAKSAIRAGIEHLLQVANVRVHDIDNLFIAGGFGKHVNLANLFQLGIIPEELKPKAKVIGNASLSGAVKYLFTESHIDFDTIKNQSEVINLGTSIEFQELFIQYIPF